MIRTLIRTNRKPLIWAALFIIVIVALLSVWYRNIYSDPRRVFDAMLENSLRTQSVTKQIVQGDESQSLDQKVRLQIGEKHVVQGLTTLSQAGQASATVVTESIGTPTSDYVRYRSIETNQKSVDGGDLDFSKVLGVWGKSEPAGETAGELYNETTLSVIPFGNLSAENRHTLMGMISAMDVYKVEYANVRRSNVNGRPTYEYTVKVLPEAYVTLLKTYAQMAGLTQLRNIDPANYQNANALEFKVTVDIRTRRLSGIVYESGRKENYLAYGTEAEVVLPKDTVTVEELQSRIQTVQ
jgi:hypothetical protein